MTTFAPFWTLIFVLKLWCQSFLKYCVCFYFLTSYTYSDWLCMSGNFELTFNLIMPLHELECWLGSACKTLSQTPCMLLYCTCTHWYSGSCYNCIPRADELDMRAILSSENSCYSCHRPWYFAISSVLKRNAIRCLRAWQRIEFEYL